MSESSLFFGFGGHRLTFGNCTRHPGCTALPDRAKKETALPRTHCTEPLVAACTSAGDPSWQPAAVAHARSAAPSLYRFAFSVQTVYLQTRRLTTFHEKASPIYTHQLFTFAF